MGKDSSNKELIIMETNFELSKYDMGNYHVFRLESPESQKINPNQMGFAIIAFKSLMIRCSQCQKETNAVQTWWHNKLPFLYISGQEKGLNVQLCLECATEENNMNILLLKNDKNSENEKNKLKLLDQYEIENEQIEYYKLYESEQTKLVTI